MIGALEGKPVPIDTTSLVVMVGGVGYHVSVTPTTRSAVANKENVFLYVYTVAKQDSLDLYGFLTQKELSMYKMLLSVSGVGPKIALSIVDFGVSGITSAISGADVTFFTQIPKVGKKMAQKIIIELKNKIGSIADLDLSEEAYGETQDIIESLVNMGYSSREARDMIRTVPDEIATIEEKIVYILKSAKK